MFSPLKNVKYQSISFSYLYFGLWRLVDASQINIISFNLFTSIIDKLMVLNFVLIAETKYVSLQCNLFS